METLSLAKATRLLTAGGWQDIKPGTLRYDSGRIAVSEDIAKAGGGQPAGLLFFEAPSGEHLVIRLDAVVGVASDGGEQ